MLKITDFEPRFLTEHANEVKRYIKFRCPCRENCCMDICVAFTPALDGTETPADRKPWQRVGGDTFETLTLSPSILFYPTPEQGCAGWHGFLRNGNLETC